MHRQPDQEIAAILVGLKFRGWGTILRHGFDDFGNPGRAAFGEVQFLEKFTDAAVAVAAGHGLALFQIRQLDRAIRAGKTQHHQVLAGNADLDRLADLVGSVVDRIDHRFLDGGLGEVPKPLRLRALRMLDDRFLDVIPLDETDGITGDPTQRALENFLLKPISTRAFRKPHHVDLGHREKALGMLVEKQQAHVLRQRCFTRAGHHSHLAAQRLHRQRGHLVRQTTSHLAQELLHQPWRKIRRRGVLVHAIIVGHLSRQTDQLALVLALGLDGAGIAAEVVTIFLRLARHRFRNLVGPGQPARCPQHQQVPIRKPLHAQQREIRGLDEVAETQQLILDLIELVLLQAHTFTARACVDCRRLWMARESRWPTTRHAARMAMRTSHS